MNFSVFKASRLPLSSLPSFSQPFLILPNAPLSFTPSSPLPACCMLARGQHFHHPLPNTLHSVTSVLLFHPPDKHQLWKKWSAQDQGLWDQVDNCHCYQVTIDFVF